MSIETRTEIADAAASLDGITCTPYYRQSTKQGDGCVRLARKVAAANGFGMVETWQVWVVLSQDYAQAEKWIDAHDNELRAALKRHLNLTSVTPAETTFGTTTTNVVIYEGTR